MSNPPDRPPIAGDDLHFSMEDVRGETARSLIEAMCSELSARYGTPPSPLETADLAVPGTAFVLARVGGEPVGCVGLRQIDPQTAEIKRMYVVLPMRRRGIARRLLGEMERLATSFGYQAIRLETGNRQPEAIQLYESC